LNADAGTVAHFEAAGIVAWALVAGTPPKLLSVVYSDCTAADQIRDEWIQRHQPRGLDVPPDLRAVRYHHGLLGRPDPVDPALPIIHGNADIERSMLGDAAAKPEPDLFPERDDLRDPELQQVAEAYRAALRSIPLPIAPVYDYSDLPADWDQAIERATALGGPF